MLLILEIIATVRAWKAGWGARTLIPWAVFMGMALIVGMGMAADGPKSGGMESMLFLAVFDVLNVITLFIMAANPPVPVNAVSVAPAAVEPAPAEEPERDLAAAKV